MKTAKEIYEEIRSDEGLRESFAEAVKEKKVEAFLKNHGCEISVDELTVFIRSQQDEAANTVEQLSLEELEGVTGGFPDVSECINSCFIQGFFVAWLHDFCPKCAAYFGNKL